MKKTFNSKVKKALLRLAGTAEVKQDPRQEAMEYMFPSLKHWKLDQGDYLEFGVYKGKAFIKAYKLAQKLGLNHMNFYAFDSFLGLPAVGDEESNRLKEQDCYCSENEFRKNLQEKGVNTDKVFIIPGFYDDSLTIELKNQLNIKRAAIVWVDCDIYKSTVPVLDFITDYVTTGSFIAFDDWFLFGADPHAGEIRAVREWLEKNKQITLEYYRDFGMTGRIFLVQKW